MKDENFQICLNLSKELDEVVEGNLYKCPHCGNYFRLSDAEETTDEDGDTVYICPNKYCKEQIAEYELEEISIYDYFADAFDIEYIVNSRKEYQAIRITVATGGPAIWIDTDKSQVCYACWGERAQASILPQTCQAIDAYGEELFGEY